jgi:hypothetical protein
MANSRISRLWKFLAAFSGILCLLFLVLWILSCYRGESLRRHWSVTTARPNPAVAGDTLFKKQDGYWELRSDCGLLMFYWQRIIRTYDGNARTWDDDPIAAQVLAVYWRYEHDVPAKHFRPDDFAYNSIMGVSHYDPYWLEELIICEGREPMPLSKTVSGSVTTAPHWMLVLLTAIPVFIAGFHWFRERCRARPGLCRHCGYDLRAHQPGDRCPECGTAIPPSPCASVVHARGICGRWPKCACRLHK